MKVGFEGIEDIGSKGMKEENFLWGVEIREGVSMELV